MFSGNWVRVFPPAESEGFEVTAALAALGTVSVDETSNNITIAHGIEGFGYELEVLASQHRLPDGWVRITVRYSARPSIPAWVLAICFFPVGLLIFLLPYKAKEEFEGRLVYV